MIDVVLRQEPLAVRPDAAGAHRASEGWIIGEARQNTLVTVAVPGGNETMGVIASNIGNPGQHLAPAASRVQKLSDAQHSWLAAFHHVSKRSFTFKHRVFIRQLYRGRARDSGVSACA